MKIQSKETQFVAIENIVYPKLSTIYLLLHQLMKHMVYLDQTITAKRSLRINFHKNISEIKLPYQPKNTPYSDFHTMCTVRPARYISLTRNLFVFTTETSNSPKNQ